MRLVAPPDSLEFDLIAFDVEYPVFDPFVDKLNNRERDDKGNCWHCQSVFDRASGVIIKDADPNCDEILNQSELCPECTRILRDSGMGHLIR